MTISPISDLTTSALHVALDGLDQRQQAIAANIANLETPGYLAREVNFEDSLRAAIETGRPDQTKRFAARDVKRDALEDLDPSRVAVRRRHDIGLFLGLNLAAGLG